MNQFNVPGALQTAIALHQGGNFRQAEVIYQQILHAEPHHPDALHLLGLAYHQQGASKLAVPLIKRAIAINPTDGTYQFNLGNLYQDLGQLDEAMACFEQALEREPGHVDALVALGTVFKAQGRLDEAIDQYRRALHIQADHSTAYVNLAKAFVAQGQIDETVVSDQQTLLHSPPHPELQFRLGNALQTHGMLEQAVGHYRQSLLLNPDDANVHFELGNALLSQRKLSEANESYLKILSLVPSNVDAKLGYSKVLLEQGRLQEAIEQFQQVLRLQPMCASAHSDLLLTLQYLTSCSAEALFREHERYAQRIEGPLKPLWQPHANNRESTRRLKVGYVSGDFCGHVVAYFILPILAHHNKSGFEIYGYYNNARNDDFTATMIGYMDHFTFCASLSDEQLAERIRADGIDILVDLSGHTAHNRLPVFARKPAPVQATYIGYPGSTGLSAIDYRISDPWQDPSGLTERYHSETVVRIPGGMAFAPIHDTPAVNALPALASGNMLLACLNNLSKVGPEVINLWARILLALPRAEFLIGNLTDPETKARLLLMFEQAGVPEQRLRMQPRVSMAEYLALHHKIDIALDPFPYNGGTTTMFSLWMGVPVITLAGDHAVSRLSAAHLARVGLDEFITHSEDEYVQCAVNFANDLPKLDAVRQSLRQRMTAPACDPANITRRLESAYRDMWRTWCRS